MQQETVTTNSYSMLSEPEVLQLLLHGGKQIMLVVDAQKQLLFANTAACLLFDCADQEALAKRLQAVFPLFASYHQQDSLFEQWQAGQLDSPYRHESVLYTATAAQRLIEWQHTAVSAQAGNSDYMVSIGNELNLYQRQAVFAKKSNAILKMIASAVPMAEVYKAICLMLEEQHPRMRASILRLQAKRLFHCSAPSLPKTYIELINGIEIGPNVGSCGTAAFTAKRVIVSDIANDPLWAGVKDLVLPYRLRACWSEPVYASDGSVLGTFAMYFDQPSEPSEIELQELNALSGLVAMAMEKESSLAWMRKLSLMVEQSGEAILIIDRQLSIEFANPAVEKITAYRAEELIGQSVQIFDSGLYDADFYQQMKYDLLAGKVWQGKLVTKKKDGILYPSMLMMMPIHDEAEYLSHFVLVQQDMTAYELLESKFHQAQKMEAIGTLVGGIAHDFNNTLAGITGNLFLLKKLTAHLPKAVRRLEMIESLSRRAADMIAQLLSFARKDRQSLKPVQISSFLKEVMKVSHVAIPSSVSLEHDIINADWHVLADINLLQQVFLNLINNARDAVADTEKPRIKILLDSYTADDAFKRQHPELKAHHFVCISIIDNGAGIRADILPHIFEPFFTTKELGKGTGLGLAMCYGSIQSHGGCIDVVSELAKGTSMQVYLPILKDKPKFDDDGLDAGVLEGAAECVLCVDDDASVLEVTKAMLESLNYKVLTASDGREAVEVYSCHKHEIDILMSDIVMPHLNGMQLARALRSINPTLKVLFVTAYDRSNVLKGENDLKVDHMLLKPYDIIQLSHELYRLLHDVKDAS